MLTDSFLNELKDKWFSAVADMGHTALFETRQYDFINRAGRVETNISRGDLFEKVCISTIRAQVTIPDRNHESTIEWLGIQTFPRNPLVPVFMGVFENVAEEGESRCPCYFDVFPVVESAEDKEMMRTAMADVFGKHNRNYPDLPQGYMDMFQTDQPGTGVGYCVGMALPPKETDKSFFRQCALTIKDAYRSVVNTRKEMPHNREHEQKMFSFRSEWLRFTFMDNRFFKGGIQLGVPAECFMEHMLPPVVRF